MKKLIVLALTCALTLSARATFSVIVQAGDLKADAAGDTPLATGSLLLLVAAGADGIFDNTLSPGEYVAGDDVIIAAFSANNNLADGNLGTFSPISNLTGVQGQDLELRWFPQITYSSYNPSSPNTVATDSFGDYAGPTTGTPNGGSPWVVPANNASSYALNFVTQSLNTNSNAGLADAKPNIDGYATSTVIPEPATLSFMLGAVALGALTFRRRK